MKAKFQLKWLNLTILEGDTPTIVTMQKDDKFKQNRIDTKSYAHLKHILKMKAHLENESNFENESIFWKWKHILKTKAHFRN